MNGPGPSCWWAGSMTQATPYLAPPSRCAVAEPEIGPDAVTLRGLDPLQGRRGRIARTTHRPFHQWWKGRWAPAIPPRPFPYWLFFPILQEGIGEAWNSEQASAPQHPHGGNRGGTKAGTKQKRAAQADGAKAGSELEPHT